MGALTQDQQDALDRALAAATQPQAPVLSADQAEALRRALEMTHQPLPTEMGPATAATTGLANGFTFGFGDNGVGLLAGALGQEATPQGADYFNYDRSFGDRYAAGRDRARGMLDTARTDQPVATGAGEVLGGAGISALTMPVASGGGLLAQAGKTFGLGAAEGAAFGAGNADGQDVAQNAAIGGAIGGVTGLLAPAVTGAARIVADPLIGAVQAVRGVPYMGRAGRRLTSVMDRAGMTAEDVARAVDQAAAQGQGMFVTADALGGPGQRALAGVARQPGVGREEIRAYLESRQLDQADRVAGFASEALGLGTDTARQARTAATALRSGTAAPNYAAAEAGAAPVDVRRALAAIDSQTGPWSGSGIDPGRLNRALQGWRGRLASTRTAPDGSQVTVELSDFASVLRVKQELQDAIRAAQREGRNFEVMQFSRLADELDAALEAASPGYRQANDTFRAQSQALGAIDTGAEAARPQRTEDALGLYRGLPTPPGQPAAPTGPVPPGSVVPYQPPAPSVPGITPQEGFRIGFGDSMLVRGENTTPTSNATLPWITPKNRELMGLLAEDPSLWASRLGRETTMADTRRVALGGSDTAGLLADQADVNGNGAAISAMTNVATGNIPAALGSVTRGLLSAGTGLTEETRNRLAQALLSPNPREALAPLLRAAAVEARGNRAAEALLRQLGYQAGQSSGLLAQ